MREPPAQSKSPNAAKDQARADRLAQALRANLARRKGQQRARSASDDAGPEDKNDKNEG